MWSIYPYPSKLLRNAAQWKSGCHNDNLLRPYFRRMASCMSCCLYVYCSNRRQRHLYLSLSLSLSLSLCCLFSLSAPHPTPLSPFSPLSLPLSTPPPLFPYFHSFHFTHFFFLSTPSSSSLPRPLPYPWSRAGTVVWIQSRLSRSHPSRSRWWDPSRRRALSRMCRWSRW